MAGSQQPGGTHVHVSGITRSFVEGDARHLVLDGVNAHFGRGEFVALLGPSGSGKSTLLNIIAGIDEPSAGAVEIDGVILTSLDERARTLFRRSHIGFVFQFFNLIPTLTVAENLRLPLELNDLPSSREKVQPLLERVGLGGRVDSYPDRLSGGEQQRIAVARALMHDPGVVLADEPTGNLDTATGAVVLDLLASLARERGRTLIVATHSEQVVARADRVYALHDGQLLEQSRTA